MFDIIISHHLKLPKRSRPAMGKVAHVMDKPVSKAQKALQRQKAKCGCA